jgi:hypothetical protein
MHSQYEELSMQQKLAIVGKFTNMRQRGEFWNFQQQKQLCRLTHQRKTEKQASNRLLNGLCRMDEKSRI